LSYDLEGVLNLRVFDVGPDTVQLGFQLSPVKVLVGGRPEPTLQEVYATFCLAVFDRQGRPLAFHFPPTLSLDDADLLAEVIRAFQVIVPPDPQNEWTVTEAHKTGSYQALYRADGEERVVTKQKIRYLAVHPHARDVFEPDQYRIDVGRADAVIRLAEKGSWLETMTGEEEFDLFKNEAHLVHARLYVDLALIPFAPDRNLGIWTSQDNFEALIASFAEDGPRPRSAWLQRERAGMMRSFQESGRTLADLLDHLVAAGGLDIDLKHQVRDYLRVYPQEAHQIPRLLSNGNLRDEAAAAVINAMELAGTPESQAALAVIMEDLSQSDLNSERAAVALGGVQGPTVETLEALWRVFAQRNTARAEDLSGTAVLALGSLGRTIKDKDTQRASHLNRQLSEQLVHAAGCEKETAVILQAMGNTGDQDLVGDIVPYLSAASPYVRSSAAYALRDMNDSKSLAVLTRGLNSEADPRVRHAMVRALTAREPSSESMTMVESLILRESDVDVRLSMTKYLAANLDKFPRSRETLQRLLQDERSTGIREYLIGKLH